MVLQVARGLFVVYQMVDGGMTAADGARVAMTDGHRAEQHGFGVEGEQTIGQQFADAREILQRLGGLDGAQHTGNGSQYACLRTGGNGASRRRFLEHAAVAGRAGHVGKRLTVEAQDAAVRERFARHDTRIIDEELHGEVVGTVHHEVVLPDDVERVRRVEKTRAWRPSTMP